eukprot:TRINITY_DN575195_c1_g2_i1.p1 TRINITY_DN575195_c1_g2~~TRINITY_DN575195_c1_g2_i1.p1  ORF type:complete len:455 (-),score=72.32 TRINITY_DN575195_c1_g2_i1:208-1572(-)
MSNEDLSERSGVFRSKLIDEFRLNDDLRQRAARFSSQDLLQDVGLFNKLISNSKRELIKFRTFRRKLDPSGHMEAMQKRLVLTSKYKRQAIFEWAHWITNHSVFLNLVIALIIINAISLGISTELDEETDWRWVRFFSILDGFVLMAFVLEILLKLIDNFVEFWNDGWNIFDFLITFLSVVSELIVVFMGSSSSDFSSVAVQLRVFRILRSLKMVARFRSLRVIVRTVLEALQSMGFVLLLLTLISYIFGILAVNLFTPHTESQDENLRSRDKFEDVGKAFLSLFQLLTLDQWYSIERDIGQSVSRWITIPFFCIWVWLGAFVFRNVFVGVMVRNFQTISKQLQKMEKEQRDRKKIERGWKKMNAQLDKQIHSASLNEPWEGNDMISPSRDATQWAKTVKGTLPSLASNRKGETQWPRDTLFHYYRTLETLQENMKEYEELQLLAVNALTDIFD